MSEHRYDIRISENYVDPNPLKVERQDPDNFTCFQTRKRCAWEIAAYVFNSKQPEPTTLNETKLFYFHDIFKKNETKLAKRNPTSLYI